MFRESRNVVPNRIAGYVRVSKISQTVEQQLDALRVIGVAAVYADEGVSGAQRDRDGLSAALQPGDTLAVVALDRLGRDLSDLVRVVDGLRKRGAHLRSLRQSIDTTTAAARMLFRTLGALSEYKRAMIQERTTERLAAKKRRGERVGRKPALSPSQVAPRELDGGGSATAMARNCRLNLRPLYRRTVARKCVLSSSRPCPHSHQQRRLGTTEPH